MGEWWLRRFPAQDLAPATLETYAQQYRRHVHPCFGERALAEITGLDLVPYQATFARLTLRRSSWCSACQFR